MKLKKHPIFMAVALFANVALADDAPGAQPVKSPTQKMQECMAQEHANNNAMSTDELKKACAAKLQSDQNHPSRPQPSPASNQN